MLNVEHNVEIYTTENSADLLLSNRSNMMSVYYITINNVNMHNTIDLIQLQNRMTPSDDSMYSITNLTQLNTLI